MAVHRTELIARYRALVVAPASASALREAVDLACAIAGVEPLLPPWIDDKVGAIHAEEARDERLVRELNEDVAEFMRERFDAAAHRRRRKRQELAVTRRVLQASSCLLLPDYCRSRDHRPPGGWSLLVDTCLVVFHQLYFGVLEALPPALSTLRDHAVSCAVDLSRHLPLADQARVRAMVHELHGDAELAGSFLREEVERTQSESHEFLTVLQSAWSQLIERGRTNDALMLLQAHARRVVDRDVAEFEQLVLETMRIHRAA